MGALKNLDLLLLLWLRHFHPLASCAAPLASLDLFYLSMVMIIAVLHDNTDTNGSRRSAMALLAPKRDNHDKMIKSGSVSQHPVLSAVYRDWGEIILFVLVYFSAHGQQLILVRLS